MTSRLNIKFVIPLALAVVVVLAGGYFAVTKFVLKSAAQHAAIAERAMIDGDAAYKAGDIEEANAFYDRATKNLSAAFRKDSRNTGYLYQSMVANRAFVCTQLTEAENRLSMIYNASKIAHDATGADLEDQRQYYELMMSRHRMGLLSNGSLPWVSYMNDSADNEYQADPSNDLALRWRGISGVYLLRNDMPPEEREAPLDDLRQALDKAGDEDPQLLHAMAVWHYNEAKRLRDAAGRQTTEASTQQYTTGRAFSLRAYQTDADDPLIALNHLSILMSSPLDDEVREQIGQVLLALTHRLIEDKDAREALYPAEISRVAGWLASYDQIATSFAAADGGDEEAQGVAEYDHEALALALTLGERYAADAPDRPDHHQVHVQALLANNNYEDALAALQTGIKATRRLGPEDYLIDLQTKIAMIGLLAETNINLAIQAEEDAREPFLTAADAAVARYLDSEGADTRFHEARAAYLAGRAAFVRGTPHLAVPSLEQANAYYKNTDLQTLSLLAKAHDRSGNLGTAAEHYERLLQIQPRLLTERLRVAQLYIGLGGDKLPLAEQHLTRFLEYNPGNLQAQLLMAQLAATVERFDKAAEIVAAIGLEENPRLIATYAQYLAQDDQEEQALAIIKERLATEPNDTGALSMLFILITDEAERLAELTALEQNGLEPELAGQYRQRIANGGQMSIEDYIKFARDSGTEELLIKKQLYYTYAQTSQIEKMRETLAEMTAMAPNDVNVLEWRFTLAVIDKDFALADRVIADIMALPAPSRPKVAAGNGAFLRAQVLAGRAQAQPTPDLREAIRAYRRALEEHATYAPGWVELGRLYLAQQDWARAVETLTRAYRIQPTNLQAAMLLAHGLRQNGETDLALDIYRSATRRQPNNKPLREAYLALEASSGVRRLAMEQRQSIREDHPDDMQNRQALAVMLAEDGRYEDGLAEVDAMEQEQGVSLPTAYTRATVHKMADDIDAGVEAIQRYIADRGDEADSNDYLALGSFLRAVARHEEAVTAYEQSIALEDPQTRRASREWASTLARGGQLTEAAARLVDLVGSFPDEDALKYDLAQVYIAMNNAPQAEATLGQVPDSAQKEKLRAQLQMQLGETDAALTIARNAQTTYPGDTNLAIMEARLLSQLGQEDLRQGQEARGRDRLTQAKTIYERLVRINSSLYEQRILIARIDNMLGDSDSAIDQLVRLLDENAGLTAARLSLFDFYIARASALPEGHPQRQQIAQLALTTIAPLVQEQPDNINLLRHATSAAREAGNLPEAIGYAQTVYDLTGEAQDMGGLVAALLSLNQPREALALLNKPEHASDLGASGFLRGMQARALAGSGRTDEARNLFKSLLTNAQDENEHIQLITQIRLSPLQGELITIVEDALGDGRSARIDLILAIFEQSQGKHEEVIRRLSPWEQSPASDPAVHRESMLTLALAYQFAGGQDNLLSAKRVYESLLDQDQDTENFKLLNNLADLLTDPLLGGNHGEQAVRYAQRAVALINDRMSDVGKAQVLDTLGWAQFRAGDPDAAIATLRRSIQTFKLAVNQKHMGQVYMAQGNDDQALLHLDNARVASNDPAERAEIQALIDQVQNR